MKRLGWLVYAGFFFFLLLAMGPLRGHAKTTQDLSEELSQEVKTLGPEAFDAAVRVVEAYKDRTSDAVSICQGRLTLTTALPVTTSDVTNAGTIYFAPYNGSEISLYASSKWNVLTFAETSVSVPATTTTPFDIYAYNNTGTVALETVNWTNDTTRATALTTQDGVYVKTGDTTRRYLGTARTTGVSAKTEDSVQKRFLWNECNRVARKLLAQSNSDTWNYTSASWRAANNSTTTGVTRVEFVLGRQTELVKLGVFLPGVVNSGAAGVGAAVGIGLNSTTVNSADFYGTWATYNAASAAYGTGLARYRGHPGVGYFYGQWIEASATGGTTSWYTYFTPYRVGGLDGEIWG